MAGRNLFANDLVEPVKKGRNLFAKQPVEDTRAGDGTMDAVRSAILNAPAGSELAEFGSAINRGAANIADFFITKPINAASQLMGGGEIVKNLSETSPAIGNFMEDGLAKSVIRTSGEMLAPAGVGGQVIKQVAKAVPALRAMGGASPAQDLVGGALSGAGIEGGGAAGEAADIALGGTGETGKEIGKLAGSVLFPVSGAILGQTAKKLTTDSAKALLKQSTPTIDGLKTAARGVYKEIDNLGATIYSSRIAGLGSKLKSVITKAGFDKDIHPKVNAALKRFEAAKGSDLSVSEIDTLRKIAGSAAKSNEPDEQRLGSLMVNKIDDFLDGLKAKDFKNGGGEVGAKFRDARQLWRRVIKSEQLEKAFTDAADQASGFENGIRIQFRQILKSPKKSRGFTKDELDSMRQVVRGTSLQNTAKMIGRLGFSEGQASNMLLGSLGVAGGAAVGGTAGAVAVPLIGQVSRNLAQKLTRKGAETVNNIVRAGSNANEIARQYIKSIPKNERSPQELAELLLRPDVALNKINLKSSYVPKQYKKLISDAVFLANAVRNK